VGAVEVEAMDPAPISAQRHAAQGESD
jgi:hypothetical protein